MQVLLPLVKIIPKPLIRKSLKDPDFLKSLLPNDYFIASKGYCPCCDKEVSFHSYHPWLRDHFICPNCRSIPRERALMLVIEKYYPDWKTLNIHESSPGNRGVSMKLKSHCTSYVPTYYYPKEEHGSEINGYRNENLENQTFSDASFDLVISQDVLEHVYNPSKAFSEIARTLKSGGAHIFTVPLINKFKTTERWAKMNEDGSPFFLKKPEYHDNPVDPTGSPVTMHWGYDIVDYIKKQSGMHSTIEYIDDLHYGVRAEYIEVIVSQKD